MDNNTMNNEAANETKKTSTFLETLRKIYIVDLVIRLCKAKNIPSLIYLVLNTAIIASIFGFFYGPFYGTVIGLTVYIISVSIALSPVGEAILRFQHGCSKIVDRDVLNRIEPLFFEVYNRAVKKQTSYVIHPEIKLYIQESSEENAFALGRRTVCITTGLLALTDEEIKGILAHEMGHLANRDTDLIMLITIGNFMVSIFVLIIKIFFLFFQIFIWIAALIGRLSGTTEGRIAAFFSEVFSSASAIFIGACLWIWTNLGVLLVMKSSRNQEFAADRFSCELGYADGLLTFFESINGPYIETGRGFADKIRDAVGLFNILNSSHPSTKARIKAIKDSFKVVETK